LESLNSTKISENLNDPNFCTGSLKSPQMKKGSPTSVMTGMTLASNRSLGRLPSLYLLANPYKEMTSTCVIAKRTMQAENL